MVKKIDHLGIAVYSIAEARTFYEKVLGLSCERIEEVKSQQVRTAFFTIGETRIELLEPTAPDSPIARFLARHGEGIHHIGYLSDDLETQLDRARENGCHRSPIHRWKGRGEKDCLSPPQIHPRCPDRIVRPGKS
jgi:methylmalonyl-CoA/ethylmalonyl-CoA epimerase